MEGQVFFCFLLFASAVMASDVIELSDSDFSSRVKGEDIILVEFFAPWCGHCKRLAPEYEVAATKLLSNDPPVPLAKVDCTEAGKETCSKYGVSGYPTLKVFRNGEPTDYSGPRESDGIISYMRKQAGPSATPIKDKEHLDKLLTKDDLAPIVLGFFSGDSSSAYKAFTSAASSLRDDFKFAYTFDADLAAEYSVSEKVVLARNSLLKSKMEEQQVVHEGKNSKSEIESFVRANAVGLCGVLTQDNAQHFKKPLLTAYYNLDYKKDPKGSQYWRNRVMKIAKENSDNELYFSVANLEQFGRELVEYGLEISGSKDPVVAIMGAQGEKFPMKEKFSVDNLRAFVQQYLAGELEPYLKSEEVPEDNEGPVKVVVAKTFEEIVNDPTKDVLIEFYAPWCGHCKSLAPKYEELGEKLSGDDNIVIAKMDATANDVPGPYNVRGFPTIYWAPMGSKNKPKKYEGGREVSDFVDYIKKQATNPVNLDDGKKKKKKSEL